VDRGVKMGNAFDNLDGLSKSRLVSIVSLLLIEIESARREDRNIADHLRDLCPDVPEAGYLLARLQWKERHQEVLHEFAELVALGGYCGDDVRALRAARASQRSGGKQDQI